MSDAELTFKSRRRPPGRRLPTATLLGVLVIVCSAGCDRPASVPHGQTGYVQAPGNVELFFRVLGSAPDTAVVIHGGPGAGLNTVVPSMRALSDHLTLIFFDQRGGGRSTLPQDTTRLKPADFVSDLEAIRTDFGLDQMTLITHSFGSILAAEYALTHPDRISRIVLHGATGPELHQALSIMRQKSELQGSVADSELIERSTTLLKRLMSGTAEDPVETCREYERLGREAARAQGKPTAYTGTQCDMPAEAVSYYFRYTAQQAPRYFGEWDYTSALDRVKAPTLVVYGANDSLALPMQESWAAAFPNGRLLLVPGAGKAALSENPAFVISAIDSFMQGIWPSAADAVELNSGK